MPNIVTDNRIAEFTVSKMLLGVRKWSRVSRFVVSPIRFARHIESYTNNTNSTVLRVEDGSRWEGATRCVITNLSRGVFPPQMEVTANNNSNNVPAVQPSVPDIRFPTKLTAVRMTQREGTTAMPRVGIGGGSGWLVFHRVA
jgi:hypothetical protein